MSSLRSGTKKVDTELNCLKLSTVLKWKNEKKKKYLFTFRSFTVALKIRAIFEGKNNALSSNKQ